MKETIRKYLISNCPSCGSELTFDNIHLMCNNEICPGRVSKQLSTNAKLIDIKGIGPKTMDRFSEDFEDLIDVISWVRNNGNTNDIEKYGIKYASKSHKQLIKSFESIKSITYGQAIVMLGFNNVGLKLAEQVANHYFKKETDFSGHDKNIISMLCSPEIKKIVEEKIEKIENCGIKVDLPSENLYNNDTLFVCMTGSPKKFGFKSKDVFLNELKCEIINVSLNDKTCKYLITDDYNSNSNKMLTAKKKNIEILTYNDFLIKHI